MALLGEAGDRLAAQLRERENSEAEIDASLTMLGALMFHYLNQICADPDHPRFVPGPGYDTRIGTPNPDTTYHYAAIDGAGTYRLSGERGTTPDVSIMAFGRATGSGQQTFPPFDFAELDIDPNGRFDVTLSPVRPHRHTGDWWQLDTDMRSLMLRCTSQDWGAHRDPRVAILRLDNGAGRRRWTNADLSARLETMASAVERMVSYGIRKVDELRAQSAVNQLTLIDYTANGGMPGQYYHEGVFDLAPREALCVEVDPLPGGNFSLSLTDPLFCTIDWTHAHSSLNQNQAMVDDDGALRVVIAHEDPGVSNWLDTTGYRSGIVQCRWMGQDRAPLATTEVVAVESLLDSPPPGAHTMDPSHREEILRERAIGAQLRSFW